MTLLCCGFPEPERRKGDVVSRASAAVLSDKAWANDHLGCNILEENPVLSSALTLSRSGRKALSCRGPGSV